MINITGLVLTYNGERLLEKCLSSLDFCTEILIIDSGSTDATLEIAKSKGSHIIHNDWNGAIEQHKFALTQINTEWIVTIDQDEIISPELRSGILSAIENSGDLDGFYCHRCTWYFDRFIRHSGWYPDKLFRIFRKEGITVGGIRPHEELRPRHKSGEISADIIHYPYKNFAHHLDKINDYTQDAAEDLYARGKRGSTTKAVQHAVGKFLKQYVLQKGFLDGRAGLIIAIHGFFYTFQKYIRLAELEQEERK